MTAAFIFIVLITLVAIGVPIAFAMLGTALSFGYGVFGPAVIHQVVEKVGDVSSNFVLSAIVLFVFMGCMMERAKIADRLFESLYIWTRPLPGGLAVATLLLCVIFAATAGVVGATETVVGLLAIPVMLRHGYNKPLLCGTICAGGSLGTIIPPSIIPVVIAPLANVSVGDLLVGMTIPGLLMAGLYILYVIGLAMINPRVAPRIDDGPRYSIVEKIQKTWASLIPPAILIGAVLGSMLGGVASPSEAGGIGALGAVGLSVAYGGFTWAGLHEAVVKTVKITAMIMTIVLAGSVMTGVFSAAGGIDGVRALVNYLGLGKWGLLWLVLALAFLAGFILDWMSIALIMIPIFTPLIVEMGHSPEWFCILFLVVLQTSYLTPPMAPAIFYLRAISPASITTSDMYRGVIPFIVLQVITLLIVMIFPQIALWLPSQVLGFK